MSQPTTLGALRDTGYRSRSVKTEIRENLLARLRSGETAFPGIVGFDDTVLPAARERAARRPRPRAARRARPGQDPADAHAGGLLDEWTPVVDGCEINDDPIAPVCVALPPARRPSSATTCRSPGSTATTGTARSSRPRTPASATSSVTSTRSRSPRAARWATPRPSTTACCRAQPRVFGLNELPDLAERIQVALFNVLEERDIQVRGYSLRLPLDVLLVATANPEDYTNRGRIITPLKDRFGAEIRTHYPLEVDDEVVLSRQEARRSSPRYPTTCSRSWPGSPAGCASRRSRPPLRGQRPVRDRRGRGGGRVRAAPGRADRRGRRRRADLRPARPWCRRCAARSSSRWARRAARPRSLAAPAAAWPPPRRSGRLGGLDLSGFTELFAEGATVETGELVPAADLLARSGRFRAWPRCSTGSASTATTRRRARSTAALEFVLEGLHLTRRSTRTSVGRPSVYGGLSRGRRRPAVTLRGLARRTRPAGPPFDVRALDEIGRRRAEGSCAGRCATAAPRRRRRAGLDECAARSANGSASGPRAGPARRHPRAGPGSCSTRRCAGARSAVPRPLPTMPGS